jgi:hypothetical protein
VLKWLLWMYRYDAAERLDRGGGADDKREHHAPFGVELGILWMVVERSEQQDSATQLGPG